MSLCVLQRSNHLCRNEKDLGWVAKKIRTSLREKIAMTSLLVIASPFLKFFISCYCWRDFSCLQNFPSVASLLKIATVRLSIVYKYSNCPCDSWEKFFCVPNDVVDGIIVIELPLSTKQSYSEDIVSMAVKKNWL